MVPEVLKTLFLGLLLATRYERHNTTTLPTNLKGRGNSSRSRERGGCGEFTVEELEEVG